MQELFLLDLQKQHTQASTTNTAKHSLQRHSALQHQRQPKTEAASSDSTASQGHFFESETATSSPSSSTSSGFVESEGNTIAYPYPLYKSDDERSRWKMKPNQVGTVFLYGVRIVSLAMDGKERLCLAQISNTLLKDYSYNEIHNRRVALGITCVQCTPVQLEILRRAGAMPISSRRCGMITKREAERLCKSFLGDNTPPKLPENFAFEVYHECAWGCRGQFVPSRYNSSRAKCIKCHFCAVFFSPNKFVFHSHRLSDSDKYVQPDAANFNSWRRHTKLLGDPPEEIVHAWEDIKAMFNGGTRKRMLSSAPHAAQQHSQVLKQSIKMEKSGSGGGSSAGEKAAQDEHRRANIPRFHSIDSLAASSSPLVSNESLAAEWQHRFGMGAASPGASSPAPPPLSWSPFGPYAMLWPKRSLLEANSAMKDSLAQRSPPPPAPLSVPPAPVAPQPPPSAQGLIEPKVDFEELLRGAPRIAGGQPGSSGSGSSSSSGSGSGSGTATAAAAAAAAVAAANCALGAPPPPPPSLDFVKWLDQRRSAISEEAVVRFGLEASPPVSSTPSSAGAFSHFSAFRPVSTKLSEYFSLRAMMSSPMKLGGVGLSSPVGSPLAAVGASEVETSCSEVSTTVDKEDEEPLAKSARQETPAKRGGVRKRHSDDDMIDVVDVTEVKQEKREADTRDEPQDFSIIKIVAKDNDNEGDDE